MLENSAERPEISVVSPAFNEVQGIVSVVQDWIRVLSEDQRSFEIVIADDGSSDGTGESVLALADPRVRVLRHEKNRGYGYALRSALNQARGRFLVTIDSDGQFDLRDYRSLLTLLTSQDLDLVTGFREQKEDTWFKVVADRVLNLIVRLGFGLKLKDTNCALKVMKQEVAQALTVEAAGFPTPTELVVRAKARGFRIGEAPVRHRPRSAGKSKLRTAQNVWQFLLFLFYLRLQLWLQKRGVIQGEKNE